MTPEIRARQLIDHKLEAAGWAVQDTRQLNLGAARGVAVREYPTDSGPADYVLFVNREPIDVIEALHDALSHLPLMLITELLWSVYARVQESKFRGNSIRRQPADLATLVRFTLNLDDELRPFVDSGDKRFQDWAFRHNARRATAFTLEQMGWLRLVKDHIASSCIITREDFDYVQLADKGGLQKAWNVFGEQLDGLSAEINEELVA